MYQSPLTPDIVPLSSPHRHTGQPIYQTPLCLEKQTGQGAGVREQRSERGEFTLQ